VTPLALWFGLLVAVAARAQPREAPGTTVVSTTMPQVRVKPGTIRIPVVDGSDIPFTRLSTIQGLSQTKVSWIVQDDQGFLWLGTQHGLNRYDGYNFKVFVPDPDDPDTLSGVYITVLFKDRDGRLWIGCDQFLHRFEPTHTRNRTFETARMLFAWAVARELLPASPCAGIARLHEPKRSRVFTDEEIRQTVTAFDGTRLGRYVRLLFLTGVRRDEALTVRWSDVDRDRGVWTIPPAAEKTGETRGEVRKVALSAQALELLAAQREHSLARGLGRSACVFPGEDGGA